tara:strand:+ start:9610 stop:9825 length:216 start_codon:yes stop_codon:yes gene_type:complete
MSKPTIQEMRKQLVNNEVEWVSELVIKNRHSELFDYVYENSWQNFDGIDNREVESMYMDLYGDELDEEEKT